MHYTIPSKCIILYTGMSSAFVTEQRSIDLFPLKKCGDLRGRENWKKKDKLLLLVNKKKIFLKPGVCLNLRLLLYTCLYVCRVRLGTGGVPILVINGLGGNLGLRA